MVKGLLKVFFSKGECKETEYAYVIFVVSEKAYLLFSGVFDVLVFVGRVVPGVLDVVLRHPVLGGGRRVRAGLLLFVAGPGPTSSGHDCVCVLQYLQGSENYKKINDDALYRQVTESWKSESDTRSA